jgi:hypothetical protein
LGIKNNDWDNKDANDSIKGNERSQKPEVLQDSKTKSIEGVSWLVQASMFGALLFQSLIGFGSMILQQICALKCRSSSFLDYLVESLINLIKLSLLPRFRPISVLQELGIPLGRCFETLRTAAHPRQDLLNWHVGQWIELCYGSLGYLQLFDVERVELLFFKSLCQVRLHLAVKSLT